MIGPGSAMPVVSINMPSRSPPPDLHFSSTFITNSTAETSIVQGSDRLNCVKLANCLIQQLVVDGRFTKFILNDSILLAMVLGKDVVQQCCFSCAKKAS